MIRNYLHHDVVLAENPGDVTTWSSHAPEGTASVGSRRGGDVLLLGAPVPVVTRRDPGPIRGLPDMVEDEDVVIIPAGLVPSVLVERGQLHAEAVSLEWTLGERKLAGPKLRQVEADLLRTQRRLAVLDALFILGTTAEDHPVLWTAMDADEGLCEAHQVGGIRAVTRLVRV